jgi:HYDIN/CFA65/VesB-like, Ig-like domain/Abnormal spindle-like microcephaly-assoc'd, ASPM-SPD-2-Hydin
MDLSSRWDRFAGLFFLLLTVIAMPGCQGLFGGASSGTVSAVNSKVDFGTAVVGSSKQITDIITNRTSSAVTLANAASSDASFRVTAPVLPFMLAAGQSATLTIEFAPKSEGNTVATIAILSTATNTNNAGSATEINVAVSGNAVAAGKLTVNPASLKFGNVRVGQNQMQSATLSNPGATSVTISQGSVTSGAFVINGLSFPKTLDAGQSVAFNVTFMPKATGSVNGNVTVTGNASLTMNAVHSSSTSQTAPTSVTLAVSGAGVSAGQLDATPGNLTFGSVTVGSSQNQNLTLTNNTGAGVTITQASATGAGFSLSGISVPATLNAGQTATLAVKFAPGAAGTASGSVAIASNAPNSTLNIALSGTGVSMSSLAANPTSLPFGNVTVGSNRTQNVTLTNSGGTSVTINQVSTNGAGFTVTGISVPLTLNPGLSTSLAVKFAPGSAGTLNGNLAIASNASNPTLNVGLSGTGVSAGNLAANPGSIPFGNVTVGSSQNQSITVTNGGNATVTINQVTASGVGFSVSGISVPMTLNAGQNITLTATFTAGTAGTASGNMAIASTAPNPTLNIPLSATGVTAGLLAASPTSVAFGNVQVGSTQSQTEILRNTGGSTLRILTANVSGTGFSTTGLTVPTNLNAGQSLTFNLTFTPATSGAVSGSLAFTTDGAFPNVNVSLSGTGTTPGQLTAAPATVNFGNVNVGATQNQSGTLTGAGAGVTISAVSSSNPEFAVTGLSLPLTLAVGQSVPFTYTFTPQASGASSGTITFAANASNAPITASLSGTGTPPPQHSVSLAWTASTSTVAGYNVYRGTQSGGPYAIINGSTETSTSYTDNSVQAGHTYYYVVTAVDGSGNESVNSNQAQAVVPSP